jgi:hypothetical protein
MKHITILSVSSYDQTHSIESGDLTAEEFVRNAVSLMRSQGYIVTNIKDALDTILDEVSDELRAIKKV